MTSKDIARTVLSFGANTYAVGTPHQQEETIERTAAHLERTFPELADRDNVLARLKRLEDRLDAHEARG